MERRMFWDICLILVGVSSCLGKIVKFLTLLTDYPKCTRQKVLLQYELFFLSMIVIA